MLREYIEKKTDRGGNRLEIYLSISIMSSIIEIPSIPILHFCFYLYFYSHSYPKIFLY